MLDLSRCRIYDSIEFPLYNYATAFEDGTPLAGLMNGGQMTAGTNGSPANTDLFLGVAYSTFTTPTSAVNVLEVTVPAAAPYTVTLPQTPNNGTIQVYYTANNTSLTSEATAAGVTAAGEFNLTGAVLTFDSADAGAAVTVVYTYTPTVIQALSMVGTGVPGTVWPSNVTRSIGVIQRGLIFTTLFDTSVNWNTQTSVKMANGLFISGAGTGGSVNGYVYSAPSTSSPFLGIYIHD